MYKRQDQFNEEVCWIIEDFLPHLYVRVEDNIENEDQFAPMILTALNDNLKQYVKAVSYTHLDVYKRQPNNSIHELDNGHFIQIDATDLAKYHGTNCADPTITVGSIQQGEGFKVMGSNVLGNPGTQLYSFIGTSTSEVDVTVSLFNPAAISNPTLYKYISIGAVAGDVVVSDIGVTVCQYPQGGD